MLRSRMNIHMRDDFCAFILTHGRPTNVETLRSIRDAGYTGKVFIVIDDEDETGEEYKRIYGDEVLVFSKDEVARYTDQFDNFPDRRAVLWARNACWDLAKQTGYRYFVQLDDDYHRFSYRRIGKGHRFASSVDDEYHNWTMRTGLDAVFEALVRVVETTPVKTIALSQGGDHIGGAASATRLKRYKRKAMNSFVCDTEKPFLFRGRLNDDVNTYVSLGSTGDLFFTDMELQLTQGKTQANPGGMSEVSQEFGTYVKSFYTIMAAPSCVTIRPMGNPEAVTRTGRRRVITQRLHHLIDFRRAVPLILRSQATVDNFPPLVRSHQEPL
jgi:hypothetical protein